MTTTLHLVNKSPTERNALDSCLRMARAGSAVLLIEDAVYAALDGAAFADALKARMDELSLHVLGPDVSARGLAGLALVDGVKVVDYEGFVDLVAQHDTTQSWL